MGVELEESDLGACAKQGHKPTSYWLLLWSLTLFFPDFYAQALNLDSKMIKKRQVEFIDIAMDPVETYVEDEDPTKFKSQKTGRGPLEEGWQVQA